MYRRLSKEQKGYERQQLKGFLSRNKGLRGKKAIFKPAIVISTKTVFEPTYKQKYNNFLKSDFWRDERDKILKLNDRCCICKSKNELNLHHISYKDVFTTKPEKYGNLVVLCRIHHHEFHQIYGVKRDMRKEWRNFLRRKKRGK